VPVVGHAGHDPFAHVTEPPQSQVFVAPLMHVQPSFGVPLQLASLPEAQVSAAAGPTNPEQVPQLEKALFVAKVQVWEPALHEPTPSLPGCVLQYWLAPDAH